MSSSTTYNGQIPTDPATLFITFTMLYLLISLLSADQRATLELSLQLLPFAIPYLPEGRR